MTPNLTADAVQDAAVQALRDLHVPAEVIAVPRTVDQLKASAEFKGRSRELLALLERLAERGLVRRGFYLDCPACATPTWHGLEAVAETLRCPGCLHEFVLPVERPPGSEIGWHYRLNSLVDRFMDHDALPALLALAHLTRTESTVACVVPSLELLTGGNVQYEFDFVYVADQRLRGGECKAGRRLTEKDLELGRAAARLRFSDFYYCSVVGFDQSSRDAVQGLQDELAAGRLLTSLRILGPEELLGPAEPS